MKRLVIGLGGAAIAAAAVVGYLFFSGDETPLATTETPAGQQQAGGDTPVADPQVDGGADDASAASDASETAPPPVPEPAAKAQSDSQPGTSANDGVVLKLPQSDVQPEEPAAASTETTTPTETVTRPQVVLRNDGAAPQGLDAPAAPSGPTFDVVRVEPSGETVIAGRAAPDSEVTVTLGEDGTVGTAKADRSGSWAIVAEQPLTPGSHEIGIEAKTPEGEKQLSENLVVVMVPEPKAPAAPVAGSSTAAAERQASAPEPSAVAEPEEVPVLAVLTPRSGGGASKVLPQGPEDGIAEGSLVLDTVDYDGKGRAILGGRAEPGARMLVYLDNRPIGEAVADADGRWTLSPASPILEGLHDLRVDEVDSNGTVVARVETPFSRERARPIAAGNDYAIVQPGNSLWRIARRTYGEGIRYTVIYQANADQIRDPDLIYPGQVFALPRRN